MSTTMPEPFKTIQEAIVAALLAESITCYDHLPLELYGVPSAYLSATDTVADYMRSDQGEVKIGRVPYSLKYFVSLEGDERVATVQAYSGLRAIHRALAEATLDGSVRDVRIERTSVDMVEFGKQQRPMLLVEATLDVRPTSYA
jgi:hypothetical protein